MVYLIIYSRDGSLLTLFCFLLLRFIFPPPLRRFPFPSPFLLFPYWSESRVSPRKHSFSVLTAIFPDRPGPPGYQNVSIPDFAGAEDNGGGGDNWSYKTCKSSSQIVTINKPTSGFFVGRMSFLSRNQQCQSTEGKPEKNCALLNVRVCSFMHLGNFFGDRPAP